MFGELAVAPDDLQGLSRAILVKTGVNVEVTQAPHRRDDIYWVVMRNAERSGKLPDKRRRRPVWAPRAGDAGSSRASQLSG
jgi:hypothetical protein